MSEDLFIVAAKPDQSIVDQARSVFDLLANIDEFDRVETINLIRRELHKHSPFASEPVDCVEWIRADLVKSNDYNPNSVAPPEMRLLERSIGEDGYTQPIVAWRIDDGFEVVDGFHRNRVGKECKTVRDRVRGYLPLTIINTEREDRGDRIAATIRHNRARGKHRVDAMSDIVVELKQRNWSNDRIANELGMDQDEILRLCQITGLAELFKDQEFSKSWDVEGAISEDDFIELNDDVSTYGDETDSFRVVNSDDETRIFHTHEKWECHKAGFYNNFPPPGMTKQECEEEYRNFLSDSSRFATALEQVITQWKHSCEHYLTNRAMNRIAWLGQAAMCQATGVPAAFRSGFGLLTEEQQKTANELALTYLNKWFVANGRPEITMDEAYGGERQVDIY